MSFEDEVYEYQDEIENKIKNQEYIEFDDVNLVSCSNVSIRKILWEYICWTLAGKPKGYKIEVQKRK